MTKIIAIHGGGDWYDASADYVVLKGGMQIPHEKKLYDEWYNEEYCPAFRLGENPTFYTFPEWLIERGARRTTNKELEIVGEYL